MASYTVSTLAMIIAVIVGPVVMYHSADSELVARVFSSKEPLEESISVIIVMFIILNLTFITQLFNFITANSSVREVWEFILLVLTGISNILGFSYVYFVHGLSLGGGSLVNDYGTSLYFSIVTWTTLGYGDIQPTGIIRYFASVEALMGQVYMALLIGLFIYILQKRAGDNNTANE